MSVSSVACVTRRRANRRPCLAALCPRPPTQATAACGGRRQAHVSKRPRPADLLRHSWLHGRWFVVGTAVSLSCLSRHGVNFGACSQQEEAVIDGGQGRRLLRRAVMEGHAGVWVVGQAEEALSLGAAWPQDRLCSLSSCLLWHIPYIHTEQNMRARSQLPIHTESRRQR